MDFMGTNAIHMRDLNAGLDLSEDLNEGEWMGLYIESEDIEVPTGETPSLALDLFFQGNPIVTLELEAYNDINNALMGLPTWDITTGATDILDMAIVIPFSFEDALNALDVQGPNDMLKFAYRKGNTISGTLSIYGILGEDIPESFVPKIKKVGKTQDGRTYIPIPDKNVLYLFVESRDPADLITVHKDGKVVNSDYGSEHTKLSQIVKKIETGTLDKSVFNLAPAKIIESALSDNVVVQVDHTADGTSTVYYIALDFQPRRREKSIIKHVTKLRSKVQGKIQAEPELRRIVNPDVLIAPSGIMPRLSTNR